MAYRESERERERMFMKERERERICMKERERGPDLAELSTFCYFSKLLNQL